MLSSTDQQQIKKIKETIEYKKNEITKTKERAKKAIESDKKNGGKFTDNFKSGAEREIRILNRQIDDLKDKIERIKKLAQLK